MFEMMQKETRKMDAASERETMKSHHYQTRSGPTVRNALESLIERVLVFFFFFRRRMKRSSHMREKERRVLNEEEKKWQQVGQCRYS